MHKNRNPPPRRQRITALGCGLDLPVVADPAFFDRRPPWVFPLWEVASPSDDGVVFEVIGLEDLPAFDLVIGDAWKCLPEKRGHPLEIVKSTLVITFQDVNVRKHLSLVVEWLICFPVNSLSDFAHGALSLVGGVYRNLENLYNILSQKSMMDLIIRNWNLLVKK